MQSNSVSNAEAFQGGPHLRLHQGLMLFSPLPDPRATPAKIGNTAFQPPRTHRPRTPRSHLLLWRHVDPAAVLTRGQRPKCPLAAPASAHSGSERALPEVSATSQRLFTDASPGCCLLSAILLFRLWTTFPTRHRGSLILLPRANLAASSCDLGFLRIDCCHLDPNKLTPGRMFGVGTSSLVLHRRRLNTLSPDPKVKGHHLCPGLMWLWTTFPRVHSELTLQLNFGEIFSFGCARLLRTPLGSPGRGSGVS